MRKGNILSLFGKGALGHVTERMEAGKGKRRKAGRACFMSQISSVEGGCKAGEEERGECVRRARGGLIS